MGLLDLFRPKAKTPKVHSILPQAAVREILQGRLPILQTNRLFLKQGETCHYIDKAIYEKKTVRRRYIRRSYNTGYPGFFFSGLRNHYGGGTTETEDQNYYETIRGILYITNQRLIFQGEQEGFDFSVSDLVAVQPYANCVELQCRKDHYKIFVPDGVVAQTVLQLIR